MRRIKMYIIKMTTDYFGVSYYIGEGDDMSTNVRLAKKYKTIVEAEKDCRGTQKFWDRYKVEVIES
jgi:hypothetical protein